MTKWDKLKADWKTVLDKDLNPFRGGAKKFSSEYAKTAESLIDKIWTVGNAMQDENEVFQGHIDQMRSDCLKLEAIRLIATKEVTPDES